MNNLIDKDKLLNSMFADDPKDFFLYIADFPTVQPVRKKGKWMQSGIPGWRCSCCGKSIVLNVKSDGNYCPNCGADMRG